MKTPIEILDEEIKEQHKNIKSCGKTLVHEKSLHEYALGVLISVKERIQKSTTF